MIRRNGMEKRVYGYLTLRVTTGRQAGQLTKLLDRYRYNSPLYGSPPSPWRPHARATPSLHISPRCPRRHNDRRFPTPRAGGMKSLSRGRLALPPGKWRIVSANPTQLTPSAVLLCCRCGLVGTYCATAVVLAVAVPPLLLLLLLVITAFVSG